MQPSQPEQANPLQQADQAPTDAANTPITETPNMPTTPTTETSHSRWDAARDSLSWTQAQQPTQPANRAPTQPNNQTPNILPSQPVTTQNDPTPTTGISSASGWNTPMQPLLPAPEFSSATYAPYTPYPGNTQQPGGYAPDVTPGMEGMVGRPPIRTSGPLAAPQGETPALPMGQRVRAAVTGRHGPIYAIGAAALIALLVVALVAFALGRVSGGTSSNNNGNGSSNQPVATVPSTSSSANTASAASLQQDIVNIVKEVEPSVVEITSVNSQGEAIGSGDILKSDGYIVTNDHVVNGYTSYTVTLSNGKQYAAQLVGADAQDDLAVLKINATNLTALPIASSSTVQVGDFAIAIGSPLGLQNTSTFGIVSALDRSETEGSGGVTGVLTGLTQTSAPINPGNSGGALVNLDGQLIGIPTLGATSDSSGTSVSGIGFAIPSSRVVYVVNQLITNGHLTHTNQGFLGVQGQDVTAQSSATQGVQVVGFANDASGKSPAQQGGVQSGDVITAVNGHPITSQTDLAGAVFDLAPGAKITLTVVRGSSTLTLTVTLGERPVSAS